MLNDALCNPGASITGYCFCVCPLCVLENGGILEYYTGTGYMSRGTFKQEYIPVGYVPSAAVAVWGPVSAQGLSVCLGCVSAQGGRHLPPVDRMTDACENMTFPQLLLGTVMNS